MGELRVLTARPSVQAQLIKGALEAEGIAVRLDRDSLGAVYGLDSGTFATRVLVSAADVERARRLLAELESADS
ncbi:MAG: DUF2007 domain-containing protein [Actinomycetota bacterium]|jgi:hypothetical protein|nr:DUF2007 domain-containing protein [Actinomycetota bacterium]